MNEQEYRKIEGVRSSTLTTIHDKTLAHAKYELENPKKMTHDLILGAALHDLILQGNEYFSKNWTILPKLNLRKTADKKIKADFELQYGESLLTQKDLENLLIWKKSLENHPTCKVLLENIRSVEVPLVWQEKGISCKARLDAWGELPNCTRYLLDVKTAQCASERYFKKSCREFGYKIQASHYLAGAIENKILPEKSTLFYHLVVGKTAPFLSACYVLDDANLEIGNIQRKNAMQKYKNALKTGIWAGYSEKCITLAPDHWEMQEVEDLEELE